MKRIYLVILVIVSIVCVYTCSKKEESDNKDNCKILQTSIEIDSINYKCENIYTNESYHVIFQLKNVGKNPLLIDQVLPSCGCIFVEWNREIVNPNEISEIDVEMKWEEDGYFHKSIDVYCNVDKSPLTLTINGSVKENNTKIKGGGKI